MATSFAELANVDTSMGELSLRCRREPTRQVDVYEVKLGDERVAQLLVVEALEPVIDRQRPARRFDAVLVDIDHTPSHVLDASHADLDTEAGLRRLARFLTAGGVFGLWSDDPPDESFLTVLRQVFADVRAEVVAFHNHLIGGSSANTVYVATGPAATDV